MWQPESLQQLQEARDRYLDLYDHAPVGYLTIGFEGRITGINLTGAALLGTDRTELVSRPFSRYVMPQELGRWASHLALVRDGAAAPLELMLRPGGRVPFPAQVTSTRAPATPGGEPLVRCTLQDITERRRTEVERDRRLVELQDLNEQLTRAQQPQLQASQLAAMGQLAAGVAHEMNSPLAYARSSMHLAGEMGGQALAVLRETAEAAAVCSATCPALRRIREASIVDELLREMPDLFEEARHGLDRVSQVLKDLRAFAQPSAGEWERADLRELVDHALRAIAGALDGKAIQVRTFCAEGIELRCRPGQVEQVLVNVLVNAAQAIASSGAITVGAGAEGADAWVEVSDTGVGIPAEHLARVFDPFFTTKQVNEGTGLGLSIAHGIVRAHGGRIDVRSAVGVGTAVRIALPLGGREPLPEETTAGSGRYGG